MNEVIFDIKKFSYAEGDEIDVSFIPMLLRRKLNKFGRAGLYTLYNAYENVTNPNLVFASCYGDIERVEKLITQREEDGSVRKYAFRICLSDPQLGDIMGGYAIDKLGYKKVAILYEITSEYSLGITQNFTDAFEAKGGEIVASEAYKTGDVDFRAQLSKIKEIGDFDALMIPANYKEVGLIAQQARSLGIEAPFLGVDAWMMQDLFEIAKDEVQGAVFPCAMDVNAESLQEFKTAFQEKWDMDPDKGGTDAYLAYDCFELIKYAIEKAGEADPDKIRDEMENAKDVPCLTSVISMDPETHNPIRTASIFQIQGTEFVKLDEYRFE